MHDPRFMRPLEGRGELNPDFEAPLHRELCLSEEVLQRLAFVVRHDDVQRAVSGLSDVVHRRDMRVVQSRRGLGLLNEAPLRRLVVVEVWGERLQRDQSVELRIACAKHDAHPALAEFLEDLVLITDDGAVFQLSPSLLPSRPESHPP